MPTLFDPITLGDIRCPNRILMAPLTRGRSETGHVPVSALKAEYYTQRASAVPCLRVGHDRATAKA